MVSKKAAKDLKNMKKKGMVCFFLFFFFFVLFFCFVLFFVCFVFLLLLI